MSNNLTPNYSIKFLKILWCWFYWKMYLKKSCVFPYHAFFNMFSMYEMGISIARLPIWKMKTLRQGNGHWFCADVIPLWNSSHLLMNDAYLTENFSRAKRGTKPPGWQVHPCSFSSVVYQQSQRRETGTFSQAILYRGAKVRLWECWIMPLTVFNTPVVFQITWNEMKMPWPYSVTYMIWLLPSCPVSSQTFSFSLCQRN